ncbi:hypothetical protein HAZT_HAZT003767 [Hyalella azteca]|uniref:C2H2-type domain-containing protein n=1 Tax=Hyalella azteca TaxID=294128 RepID=A0A6A0HD52_HYAAZ|nr:hypothetical protein HAZT_HAZT003767 [Hyalella azteca]
MGLIRAELSMSQPANVIYTHKKFKRTSSQSWKDAPAEPLPCSEAETVQWAAASRGPEAPEDSWSQDRDGAESLLIAASLVEQREAGERLQRLASNAHRVNGTGDPKILLPSNASVRIWSCRYCNFGATCEDELKVHEAVHARLCSNWGTTLTGATVNDDVFDVPEAKYNVHLDNHLLSTLGDLKGTGTVPRQAGSQFPLKGDEPGTALRLGSIVGSALFKGIKSPSPDLAAAVDNSAGGAHLVQRTGAGHETAHEQQKRLIIRDFSPMHMRSSSVENEPRLKNHREESSQSRGSSLGADVRLNTEHMKQPFQSMPQYSRQQSVDVPQPPTKKQKISSEPQPGDFSITSVHPVLVRNGVVLQRARVSVKEVEENNLPKKLQLCGGEVKICDGSKYKTMRIDTSECSRSHALGMSSPICEKPATIVSTIPILASKSEMSNEVKVRPESPKVFTACNTLVTKNTPPTSTKTNFSYATPDVRTSSEVPLQSDKVVPALLDQKDIFIAPRKRPDTLPLKPQQFVNKSTAQLIGSIITSPDTPRPKKSCAQLLLDGSAYTYLRLKVSTKTYYCCIFRPQPMYVPQSPESKISMYSNWQIRKPAEDNPFNLSISESMGLYSSCQCTNPAYSVAKPALSLIYTYSDRKMIDAIKFVQKEKQSLSAVTLAKNLVPSLGENKMRYGESPINSVKLSDSAGDVQISQSVAEETKISSSVSVFSREPSEDSRLSSSSSRIRICDGGFKSTEEYTYVRGRGRGRYVCETCGIRCKKPSMLKKHIRTHTNFRPYPCTLCTSRFKTKGNLTKHLKSKAHFQRCIQLGVPHEPPSSSGDDASTEMDYDDNDEDDDDDDGEEDDDEEDDECDEDMRESRENSSMRDNSRENSYVRESSCDNSYVNESREGSSMRDSRENSYLGESRENSYAREIRENSCIREIRENSCVRESRENSCIRENCENSYIRESRGCVPESRENSCIPEFAFVEENIVLGSGNGFEKNKEDFCFSTGHLLSSAAMSSHEEIKADEEVCIDLRVSKVACRSAGSPASAPDDAPMDLSIKKSSNSTQPGAILPSSLLPHVVSSAKITIASVTSSRPSFLQLVPPKSSTSLVSPLTPIREQPADILSPVTDSSMLLKSIYSTTERASRVSVLSSQAGYPHSIAASQASGVMMKAYLTQRAIQDTFIKRHQYQGCEALIDDATFKGKLRAAFDLVEANDRGVTALEYSFQRFAVSEATGKLPRSPPIVVKSTADASVSLSCAVPKKNHIMAAARMVVTSTSNLTAPEVPTTTADRSPAVPEGSLTPVPSSVAVPVSRSVNSHPSRTTTVTTPLSASSGTLRTVTVAGPSSAMNLTVLNSSNSKTGTSFLSPSGVVPNHANNRSAPEDGRCRCYICHKEFARSSQLALHLNIHYMERRFRCESCAVNMNLTFGAASTENPRPFKCHDCKIAFRIHGHLAKHLRSKMHILKLECLSKLPFGLYAEMERTGLTLANIDTTDCEHSLLSLQSLAGKLFAKEPEKLLAWRNGTADTEGLGETSRPRTVSGSSVNSDEYLLADDQDEPSPLPDSGDENESTPVTPANSSSGNVSSLQAAVEKTIPDVAIEPQASLSTSPTPSSLSPELPSSSVSHVAFLARPPLTAEASTDL